MPSVAENAKKRCMYMNIQALNAKKRNQFPKFAAQSRTLSLEIRASQLIDGIINGN